MCNSGVGLTPVVDGRTHHFAARGLHDGLSLLGDRESGSYWDHITGECVHGPLEGRRLDVFPLLHLTAGEALRRDPDAEVAISQLSSLRRLQAFLMDRFSRWGILPPGFRRTMGRPDGRRPPMDMGLGVWTARSSRYYPLEALRSAGGALVDELDGRRLLVRLDAASGVPSARWEDATRGDERGDAMQLFTRWYGFAATFPGCDVHGAGRAL